MISVASGSPARSGLVCALHEIEHLAGLAVLGVGLDGEPADLLLLTPGAAVVVLTVHVSMSGTTRPVPGGPWTVDGAHYLFASPGSPADAPDRRSPDHRAAAAATAVRRAVGQGPGRPRVDALVVVSGRAFLDGGTQCLTDVWVCRENDLADVLTNGLPRQRVTAAMATTALARLGIPCPDAGALGAEGFADDGVGTPADDDALSAVREPDLGQQRAAPDAAGRRRPVRRWWSWAVRFWLAMLAVGMAMASSRAGADPSLRTAGLLTYAFCALLTSVCAARAVVSPDRRVTVMAGGALGVGLLVLESWSILEAALI